ncbi:MAG: iron-containing alcohol dehydrogenase [Chloroflexi bacterium]|nr:MAG: iron-containing alcohol dehydrogenase [Chloroflexota bacterium]
MTGSFMYANPRVIHWGAGSIAQLASELSRLNVERIALVTTRSLLDRLQIESRTTIVIGQHTPQSQIDAGVEQAWSAVVDGIVSFGGGSAIDAAKIISVRLADGEGRALPHVAIPTTLSVAELAAGAGYTNEGGDKAGMRDPRLLVETVIYDAALTLATPIELWLSTGIRALDHDLDVRTDNQLAAWFSFTLPGASAAGLSHTMGKQIGARHGIPHGVTSCLLLPHVMRYLAKKMPDRMAVLSGVMGGDAPDCVQDLIASLGLPQHIAAYGIGEPELHRAAGELAGKLTAEDLTEIYLAAL